MRRNRIIYFILITLVLFIGCGKKEKESPKITASKKVVAKPEVKEEEKVEEKEEYLYKPSGKRDPFKPFIAFEAKKLQIKRHIVPLTPLQKYDISELKLIAIIVGMGENKAMVEDNLGKGYVVKEGDLIGKNGGVVSKIEKDNIKIRENYINYIGEEEKRDIELFLHKPEEGEGL